MVYTGDHPHYHKVSYFEFLQSLVQISERRPFIVTVPFRLSKKYRVVHSNCMRHDHKQV
jgi:hypothetical protein